MSQLRCVPKSALFTGWDFSTGSVKCLAFDVGGKVIAEIRHADGPLVWHAGRVWQHR